MTATLAGTPLSNLDSTTSLDQHGATETATARLLVDQSVGHAARAWLTNVTALWP